MAEPGTDPAFQSADDQVEAGTIRFVKNPFTAAIYLELAFTPWTVRVFPAPYIKKSELCLRSSR